MSYIDDPRRKARDKAKRKLVRLRDKCYLWIEDRKRQDSTYVISYEYKERDQALMSAIDQAIDALRQAEVWMD